MSGGRDKDALVSAETLPARTSLNGRQSTSPRQGSAARARDAVVKDGSSRGHAPPPADIVETSSDEETGSAAMRAMRGTGTTMFGPPAASTPSQGAFQHSSQPATRAPLQPISRAAVQSEYPQFHQPTSYNSTIQPCVSTPRRSGPHGDGGKRYARAASQVRRSTSPQSSLVDEPCNSEDEHELLPYRHDLEEDDDLPYGIEARESNGSSALMDASSSRGWSTPGSGPVVSEQAFADILLKRGFRILPIRPDGNCLFRALAVHVHGTEEAHAIVREDVIDFLDEEREWFSQFVAEDFGRYLQRKRRNGCYGNHLELQAAAELYCRPLEVYAYRAEPINVIDCGTRLHGRSHEIPYGPVEPIRVSFHRTSHYNCVVRTRTVAPERDVNHTALQATPLRDHSTQTARAVTPLRLSVPSSSTSLRATESPRVPRRAPQTRFDEDVAHGMEEVRGIGDVADALATEEEMERIAMALSLADARQSAAQASSSSSGFGTSSGSGPSGHCVVPTAVQALLDFGIDEDHAFEAFRNTDGTRAEMMNYVTRKVQESKRAQRLEIPTTGSSTARAHKTRTPEQPAASAAATAAPAPRLRTQRPATAPRAPQEGGFPETDRGTDRTASRARSGRGACQQKRSK